VVERPGAVEDVDMSEGFWRGRSVFVTGHTGFKGGWLSLWLAEAGAKVHGYSLQPPTEPSLFDVARVAGSLAGHTIGDIRDAAALRHAVEAARPEIVFHLAAQPLVRQSYADPVETYSVNVMGTVNVLEAVRAVQGVKVVVNVTTDKCYENKEWVWGYRESEPLGGHDPYSNSKACSELVSAAYRSSFLAKQGIALATARAGNVIGGGDWAIDRLVPDFFRAATRRVPLEVRFPRATRPWQHVLEPVSGYLVLAEQLATADASHAEAWNFGPTDDDARTVAWILDRLVERSPGARWNAVAGEHVHEANYLKLDSSKARAALRWRPRWNLGTALDKTVEWHDAWHLGDDMQQVCLQQIGAHRDATDASP
jgi:CDP-glucose 4,6-dehydratase